MNPIVKVTEYNGVTIHLNVTTGEYFCDCVTNSNLYINKTFHSTDLHKIKKAIDNYNAPPIENGEEWIRFNVWSEKPIQHLKVVKKVGSYLFFDDGTDSKKESQFNKTLYKREVLDNNDAREIIIETAKQIELLCQTINMINKEIREKRDLLRNIFPTYKGVS